MDSVSFTSYYSNHKNMTLTARKMGTLGKSQTPLGGLGTFQSGTTFNIPYVNDPKWDAFNAAGQATTSLDAAKQVVRQAAQYVVDQHFVITTVVPDLFGLYQPWLHGYNAQIYAISGPGGPSLINFYGARYWIDQSIKK